jgi:signal transduction histidine kinase
MQDAARPSAPRHTPLSQSPWVIAVIAVVAGLVIAGLWWQVIDRHAARRAAALDSWLALEMEVVNNAARAAKIWLEERTTYHNMPVGEVEQEVFRLLIDPIQLGADGDAWIYNRDHVVFDESQDFPREYFGKSMGEIFEIQKAHGAHHYDDLVKAVENAETGTTWYVWLPEKGREYAAYTSVRVGGETWTIGLSTPEAQILKTFQVQRSFRREVTDTLIISALLVGLVAMLWLKQRADLSRLTVLNESNARLERAVADRTERLQAINRDLTRSNEDLEQFAYAASHDLQAPLRTISGFLELLQRRYGDHLDNEAREFIAFSVKGAQRLSQQINGLLQYSRLTAGARACSPVPLQQVMQDVLANLRGQIDDVGARVSVPDDLPVVMADPIQLGTLLQNLIGNAVKYRHPDRRPDIGITVRPEGGRWRIEVADNGIGIPAEFQQRVFGVFQRLHGPDAYEGTGIGLALAKRIAERHGGSLTIRSDGHSGSVFAFTVPGAR